MIGRSNRENLADINISKIDRAVYDKKYSKNICFNTNYLKAINYSIGAHRIKPSGKVIYSQRIYILKHMDYLGLPFVIKKKRERFKRNIKNLKKRTGIQYTDKADVAEAQYFKMLNKSFVIN